MFAVVLGIFFVQVTCGCLPFSRATPRSLLSDFYSVSFITPGTATCLCGYLSDILGFPCVLLSPFYFKGDIRPLIKRRHYNLFECLSLLCSSDQKLVKILIR